MDTLKVKAFMAVKKYGSFSKAAEMFCYTPSAFSHIADSLEEELNVKLFKRTHKGVEITEKGNELVKYFENLLNAEDMLFSRCSEIGEKVKEVRIGAYSSISKHFLPKIIKEFREQNGEIKISVYVSDDLTQMLNNDEIDVMIASEIIPENWLRFELFTDPYVAVLPSNLCKTNQITKDEFYNFPFIDTKEKIIHGQFDLSKFKEIIDYKTDDYNSVISLVKEGVGVAVVPKLELKTKISGIKICKIEPEFNREIVVAYKKQKKTNVAISRLIDFLKNNK